MENVSLFLIQILDCCFSNLIKYQSLYTMPAVNVYQIGKAHLNSNVTIILSHKISDNYYQAVHYNIRKILYISFTILNINFKLDI